MISDIELFSTFFGENEANVFDLTTNQVRDGMMKWVKDGKPLSSDFSSVFKILDRRDKYLFDKLTTNLDLLKKACPVGLLGNSVDIKPFNNMWLSLNGEYISRTNYPLLYDYLQSIGYVPNGSQLIQLPDARGLVFRSQNKGRFTDVVEINIGKYQADATQRITGDAIDLYGGTARKFSGAFRVADKRDGIALTATGSWFGGTDFWFDNSYVARTALEERVKAIGVNAQIFIGIA